MAKRVQPPQLLRLKVGRLLNLKSAVWSLVWNLGLPASGGPFHLGVRRSHGTTPTQICQSYIKPFWFQRARIGRFANPTRCGAALRYAQTEQNVCRLGFVAPSPKRVRIGLGRKADFSYWQCYEGQAS